MTAKWIQEIRLSFYQTEKNPNYVWLEQTCIKLENINKLLSEAAFSTENEDLHDKILSEIKEI